MGAACRQRLSCCGDLTLDVFERIATVSMKIRMTESPALVKGMRSRDRRWGAILTCSPNWLSSVFLTCGRPVRSAGLAGGKGRRQKTDLVEVVFVELANKGRKV